MIAAEHRNLAGARHLLQAGAGLKDSDLDGKSPLYWAAASEKNYSSQEPDRETALPIIQLLLEAGAKLDGVTYRWSKLPLQLAAWEGNLPAAKQLLEVGADVDSRDEWGWTALHEAAAKPGRSSTDMTELLLRAGAEVDCITNTGQTPLMISVRKSNKSAASLLLRAGARRDLQDQQGKSALDLAMETDMMRLLLKDAKTEIKHIHKKNQKLEEELSNLNKRFNKLVTIMQKEKLKLIRMRLHKIGNDALRQEAMNANEHTIDKEAQENRGNQMTNDEYMERLEKERTEAVECYNRAEAVQRRAQNTIHSIDNIMYTFQTVEGKLKCKDNSVPTIVRDVLNEMSEYSNASDKEIIS